MSGRKPRQENVVLPMFLILLMLAPGEAQYTPVNVLLMQSRCEAGRARSIPIPAHSRAYDDNWQQSAHHVGNDRGDAEVTRSTMRRVDDGRKGG